MNNKNEFLKEFKALLEKHNVYIAFGVGSGSDCHGLYDERLEIIDEESSKTFYQVDGWTLSNTDIDIE
jgi:hypothetical protein